MTREEIETLKVGDRILINTFHYREGRRKVERNIVEIKYGRKQMPMSAVVGVRMFGWNPFWIRDNEIIKKIEI